MHDRSEQRFFLPFFCLTALLVILSGCSPVVWTPTWSHDSKSFFGTHGDGTVFQYDLESKSGQMLVKLEGGKPTRVAISPDDKLIAIAVAKATSTGSSDIAAKGHTIELTIVRISDKKVVTKKVQKWGNAEALQQSQQTNAYWCPSGKRILICYNNNEANGPGFAVYDVVSEKLTEMDTPNPEAFLASFLDFSPIVPDGSGYLAVVDENEKKEKEIRFVFVDWEGEKHVLKNTPAMKSFWKIFQTAKKDGLGGFSAGKWNGNVLTVLSTHGRIQIDLQKQTASIEPLSENQKALLEEVPKLCKLKIVSTFLHSSLQVRLCSAKKLEIFDPENNRHQAIPINDAAPGTLSPDGKHLLVPLTQNQQKWLYVIRDDGTIVAKLEIID